jgi:hypothetical protein
MSMMPVNRRLFGVRRLGAAFNSLTCQRRSTLDMANHARISGGDKVAAFKSADKSPHSKALRLLPHSKFHILALQPGNDYIGKTDFL